MPAVTVADPTALPRVTARPLAGRDRAARSITTAAKGVEGEGFPVRRAFSGVALSEVDPFLFMDHMGHVEYEPGEPKGTPWHPHRGFETVTYLIDGEVSHQDSLGSGGLIRDGDTQWMTAGSGILHIERPSDRLVAQGGVFHGVQLWVNLPRVHKMTPPRYQDIAASRVALATNADATALLRVITGDVAGVTGPGTTLTPVVVVHATLTPGSSLVLPWPVDHNALVYVLSGRGSVTAQHRPIRSGQLAVLGHGDTVTVTADVRQGVAEPTLDVLLLGGRPLAEPIAAHGPFVMSTHAEIAQAVADFRAGRLGRVPAPRRR